MKTIRIESLQGLDQQGDPELFTSDLFPVVPDELTIHLDGNGLPKIDTPLKPGMVAIGKIGKSKLYAEEKKPNARDLNVMDFDELREKFGTLWVDTSVYVTEETRGTVVGIHLTRCGIGMKAVVEIEQES